MPPKRRPPTSKLNFAPEMSEAIISQQKTSQQIESNNTMKSPIKLIVSGIVLLVMLVMAFMAIKVVTIEGNQLGVMETWSGGVDTNILQPKTYFLVPGWSKTVYPYDASSQVFVMNDTPMAAEGKHAKGRDKDAYLVQSQEGQDMHISLNLRWRLDPVKLVSIHRTVRMSVEEKIIRPVVMRVVKDESTRLKAIDAYSGEGLVKLQTSIQAALTGQGEGAELKERGITVENFVIEGIRLDEKYIDEIKGKQLATQKTLRAVEEQKAAEAKALVAKSEAQAEYNTKLVGQMLLATNMVINAQAENEKMIIAAKAMQQQLTLEAEGKKAAMISIAEGTLAIGKAEATATELKLKAWSGAGPDAYRQVEVARAMASGFQNIQGYLPEKVTINTLSGNFIDALNTITGRAPGAAPRVPLAPSATSDVSPAAAAAAAIASLGLAK